MTSQNYSTSFTVEQSAEAVFAAINNVRGWWTGDVEGITDKLGEEFSYRHKDIHYSRQKITELVPNKKIVWLVTDAQLNFVEDKHEWVNTEIRFEISEKAGQTEVRFTHLGLVPDYECFDSCSNAWAYYVNGSLRDSIRSAKQKPSL
jgi:hypothetical protein